MKSYNLIFKSGEEISLSVAGNSLQIVQGDSPLDVVIPASGFSGQLEAGQGLTLDGAEFDSIRLFSAVDQSVTIMAGRGEFHDSRAYIARVPAVGEIEQTVTAKREGVGVLTVRSWPATFTSPQTLAANDSRLSITIKNRSSAGVLYVDSGSGESFPIDPSESLTLDNYMGAIRLTGISGLDVAVVEEG